MVSSALSLLPPGASGTLSWVLAGGLSVLQSVDAANKPYLDAGFVFLLQSSAEADGPREAQD